jgi:hypothetical protein
MAQNIYDRPDFFAAYSELPRSVHGLLGAPEWPAVRALVPDLAGTRVADLARLARVVRNALRSGGRLVVTTEHPIFMAPSRPRWVQDEGRRVWPLDRYAEEGPRVTDWLAPGVRKHHRTLGTTVNTLVDAGFTIRRLIEWSPSPDQVAADPALAEERDRPMFLLIAADAGDTADKPIEEDR